MKPENPLKFPKTGLWNGGGNPERGNILFQYNHSTFFLKMQLLPEKAPIIWADGKL